MAEKFKAFSGDECIAVVQSAMPQASQKTLEAISDAMAVHLKHGGKGMSHQAALEAAVAQVSEKIRKNVKIRKYQEYLNLVASKRVTDYIDNNFSESPFKGLEARMMGINSDVKGSRLSAAVQQRELLDVYVSGLVGDLERTGTLDAMITGNETFHKNVSQELERIGQEKLIPETGDKLAKQAADVIHKWQEKSRIDANDAGAWIGSLPGYIVRQSHDMFRVRDMGRDPWKDLIRDKLDWAKIELEQGKLIDNKEEYLDNLFTSISTGTHLKHVTERPSKVAPGSMAKSISHERVLHFKPGEWFDYNMQAGTKSVLDAVMFGLEKQAMTTGLMRSFGPSAAYNMEKIAATLKRKYPDKVDQFRETAFKNFMNELTGETRIPGNAMMAQWGSVVRGVEAMTTLGGSAITAAITDPMIMASELRYQGASPWKGYATAISADFRKVKTEERLNTAKALGVMFQGMAAHFHSRLDADGMMSGNMSKVMSAYFKLNLLTPHTDRLRMGAAEAMGSMAASYSKKKFSDLPPKYQRVLSLFEIDEGDWNLMRKYGVEEHQGTEMLTLEGIDTIPDEAIKAAKGTDMSARQVRIAREELKSRYHSYLVDRVDTAVLRPDAKTQAYQHMGTKGGTGVGELVRSLMQLKGFPIAFLQKVVGRELYGSGATSFRQAISRPDILANTAWLMTQATLLGYGVMAAKDMVAGKEPPAITDEGVLREAALRGGGLGFYGDILFGELRKEWGRGGVSALLGPTAGTMDEMMDLAGRWRDGDLTAAKTIKTVYRQAVPNLFYIKPVLDYGVMYQVIEGLEPGSMRKMERRFKSEHDREYWLSPTEAVR